MGASWAEVAAVIRSAAELEAKWLGAVPQDPAERPVYTPWMPFQLFAYIAMLAEAAPDVLLDGGKPPQFLEIGAGIGTKMEVARVMFGADVHGIERTDEYAAAARARGLDVVTGDALGWPHYAGYQVIWFNRVFRGAQAQAELESFVWNTCDPGTVAVCANLEGQPPAHWWPILDSWADERRGIWQRPFTLAGG